MCSHFRMLVFTSTLALIGAAGLSPSSADAADLAAVDVRVYYDLVTNQYVLQGVVQNVSTSTSYASRSVDLAIYYPNDNHWQIATGNSPIPVPIMEPGTKYFPHAMFTPERTGDAYVVVFIQGADENNNNNLFFDLASQSVVGYWTSPPPNY